MENIKWVSYFIFIFCIVLFLLKHFCSAGYFRMLYIFKLFIVQFFIVLILLGKLLKIKCQDRLVKYQRHEFKTKMVGGAPLQTWPGSGLICSLVNFRICCQFCKQESAVWIEQKGEISILIRCLLIAFPPAPPSLPPPSWMNLGIQTHTHTVTLLAGSILFSSSPWKRMVCAWNCWGMRRFCNWKAFFMLLEYITRGIPQYFASTSPAN